MRSVTCLILQILIIVGLLSSILCFAQPPEIEWDRTYGGDSSDIAYSVQQTNDGGYVFAGDTRSYSIGTHIYLVKTDSIGVVDWFRVIGGVDYDDAREVEQTTDGGYIIVGSSSSFCAEYTDMYLVKTDGNGDTLWTRTYGGANLDYAESVIQTNDGGYALAGCTRPLSGASFDIFLVKTDSLGNTLWTRTYERENGWKAYSVQQTNDGGYILAGHDANYIGVEYDIYLIKTDNLGDTLWTGIYGGEDDDFVREVKQTTDGGYVVTGWTSSFGVGGSDMYVVKTDSIGDTLWTHTYGGTGGETASSIKQTPDGGYIISGGTNSYGAGSGDLYLVKIDAIGDTIWTLVYGGPYSDYGYSVDLTADGGYIVAGETHLYGGVPVDCWLVKIGPDTAASGAPVIEWVSHPKDFILHPAYPNPFNPTTTISYDVPVQGLVKVNIYNVLGQNTAELVNGITTPGHHHLNWNATDSPSGIYFVQLQSQGNTQIRKIVLIK